MTNQPALRAVVIPVDGPVRIETAPSGDDRLQYLQGIVGGYIEAVNVQEVLTDRGRRRAPATVWVNEEGKILGLPINPRATDLCAATIGGWFADVICGDVVVLGPPDQRGDETTCPDVIVDIIDEWAWPILRPEDVE